MIFQKKKKKKGDRKHDKTKKKIDEGINK